VLRAALDVQKALHLADGGREGEAIQALLDAISKAETEPDLVTVVRACCIVGLLYEGRGDAVLALAFLKRAVAFGIDSEFDDVVAYEIDQAKLAVGRLEGG
jgi:hypothetical protein